MPGGVSPSQVIGHNHHQVGRRGGAEGKGEEEEDWRENESHRHPELSCTISSEMTGSGELELALIVAQTKQLHCPVLFQVKLMCFADGGFIEAM